jgi:hypothetical protein
VDPSGKRVVTCGRDRQTIIWDGRTGKIVTVFQAHQDQVAAVALDPERNLSASYDAKGGIKVWDARSGIVQRTFSTGDSEVNCLEFTTDGDRLLAGGKDMCLRIWDVRGRPMFPNLALAKIRPIKKQMKSDRKFKAMVDAQKAMKRGTFATAYRCFIITDPAWLRTSDIALDPIVGMREQGASAFMADGRKTRETFQ